MGMSTHVIGFRAPDEQWKKMKYVYEACVEAGVEIPEAVDNFFCGEAPDDYGITVDLGKDDPAHDFIQEYSESSSHGYTIDIRALQRHYPNLTHLRFYNSY